MGYQCSAAILISKRALLCRKLRLAEARSRRIIVGMAHLRTPIRFGEFQCDRCGSLYEVAFIALSQRVSDEAVCQNCRMVMNEWRGTLAPIYKLKSRARLVRYV